MVIWWGNYTNFSPLNSHSFEVIRTASGSLAENWRVLATGCVFLRRKFICDRDQSLLEN